MNLFSILLLFLPYFLIFGERTYNQERPKFSTNCFTTILYKISQMITSLTKMTPYLSIYKKNKKIVDDVKLQCLIQICPNI